VVKTRLQVGKGKVEARGGDSSSSGCFDAVCLVILTTATCETFW